MKQKNAKLVLFPLCCCAFQIVMFSVLSKYVILGETRPLVHVHFLGSS